MGEMTAETSPSLMFLSPTFIFLSPLVWRAAHEEHRDSNACGGSRTSSTYR
jgi:hypothetical protein